MRCTNCQHGAAYPVNRAILKTRCGCWQEVAGYGDKPPRQITIPLRRDIRASLFVEHSERYPIGELGRFGASYDVRIFELHERDSHGRLIYVEREP